MKAAVADRDVLDLVRPELRSMPPYAPSRLERGSVRLHANESPYRTPGDATARGLNCYPPSRPEAVRAQLAEHYGVSPRELLITQGSSDAIDVLVRVFCSAYKDAVIVCPPTFDMYRVYAGLQGAGVIQVPLLRADDPAKDFTLDAAGVAARLNESVKLVFISSPNNPTGGSMAAEDVETVCRAAQGRALVVIDEAYVEFSIGPDFEALQPRYDIVRLRSLSKSVSLAGVRCGALIAAPRLIEFLDNILPPYTFPSPSMNAVLKALSLDSLNISRKRIAVLRDERDRLAERLEELPEVSRIWPSDGNFLLVETRNASSFAEAALRAGILVRTFAEQAGLEQCVRITVGRPEHNDLLLRAVSGVLSRLPGEATGGA